MYRSTASSGCGPLVLSSRSCASFGVPETDDESGCLARLLLPILMQERAHCEHRDTKTVKRIVMVFPCPIKLYDSSMAEDILTTPAAFRRIWFHTTEVKSEIYSSGWNPEKIKRSIYGSAIYLARKKWDLDDLLGDLLGPVDRKTLVNRLRDPKMITCVLALRTDEVMSCFPSESSPNGNTEKHLLDYLNEYVSQDETAPRGAIRRIGPDNSLTSVQFGRTPVSGNHERNKKIARYFRTKGIRAIRFLEHGEEVLAIYDPSSIRVLPQNTNFEVPPFSDILAANEPVPVL